jgi:hypothetical protein
LPFPFFEEIPPDSVVIADSFVPPPLPFVTTVVSSPGRLADRDLKDTLNQYFRARFYMPVPTADEVRALYAYAFPGLDAAGVEERLALWGPIPRLVLADVDILSQTSAHQLAMSV